MVRGSAINDPTLAELVRVKNYKQALKNIDKKSKRQATDIALLALKADLLLKNGELPESHKLCTDLVARDDASVELETVIRLNEIAHALSIRGFAIPSTQLEKLWQNTVKSHGPNAAKLDIAEEWAEQAIKNRQWNLLTKAASILSKLFPENDAGHKKYFFWQILGHWLSKPDPSIKDERMRALGRMMASRMLEKSIQLTPASPKDRDDTPQYSISQRHEFDLLASISLQSGREAHLVSTIEGKSLDHHSSAAVDDWGTRRTRIDFLVDQGRFDEAWDICQVIFQNAEELDLQWKSDDWAYWKRMLDASCDSESLERTRNMAFKAGKKVSRARAPAIAVIESRSSALNQASSSLEKTELLEDAKRYFDRFSDQNRCAMELQCMLRNISPADRQHFRSYLDTRANETLTTPSMSKVDQLKWITREVNVLQLDYAWYLDLTASVASISENTDVVPVLTEFTCTCLKLYRTSKQHTATLPATDTSPGDDACIMAVRALTKLAAITQDRTYLVHCALLLCSLLDDSRHNATGRLMLVNLLIFLGIPTAALKYYQDMRVRQILIESCAPLVAHRVATLLPFRSGTLDFYKTTTDHLKFYNDALEQIPRFQMTALNSENYAPTMEFDAFGSHVQDSTTRRMLRLERTRMARFRVMSCNEEGLGFDQYPPREPFDGSRDEPYDQLGTTKRAEQSWLATMSDSILISEPPLMNEHTIKFQEKIQYVFGLVFSAQPPQNEDMQRLEDTALLANLLQGNDLSGVDQLTSHEKNAMIQTSNISTLLLALFRPMGTDRQLFERRILSSLEGLHRGMHGLIGQSSNALDALSESWPLPYWEFYHATFTELEVLMVHHKLAAKATSHCKSFLKLTGQTLKDVNRMTADIQSTAAEKHRALKQKGGMAREAAERYLADDESIFKLLRATGLGASGQPRSDVGEALEAVIGMPNIKRSLRTLVECVVDSIRGIEMVTLP